MSAALVAFLVAIAAGGFGSLVGIGGGLIIVPVLSVALGYDVKTAIAASLIGVIATSVSASPRYVRSGIADRRLGLLLLVPATLGGLAGGFTAELLDGRMLSLLFALLLAGVALRMLWQIRHPVVHPPIDDAVDGARFASSYVEPTTGEGVAYQARRIVPGTAVSFVAGNISGLLGVGGGVINVPTLNVLMHVPIRVAITTSTYMLAATATASASVYVMSGWVDPMLAAPVALGVIVGARFSAHLSMRLSQQVLRVAFVLVAGIFAVSMFAEFLSP
jgi:uncharacterized membrane protein YfcA